jgi:hypothetical protein
MMRRIGRRSSFRIVHAQDAFPNEVGTSELELLRELPGTAHCRTTPALSADETRTPAPRWKTEFIDQTDMRGEERVRRRGY